MVLLGPGITPKRNPMKVPRRMGRAESFQSSRVGGALDFASEHLAGDDLLQVEQDLGHAERPIRPAQGDAVIEVGNSEGKTVDPRDIDAHHSDEKSD